MELNLLVPNLNLVPITAVLVLAGLVVLAFILELLRPPEGGYAILVWAPALTLVALASILFIGSPTSEVLHSMLKADGLYRAAAVPILLTLFLSLLYIPNSIRTTGFVSEYVALLVSSATGMLLMVCANNTLVLFLALELLSLPLYLLCVFLPERRRCQESALKYFILSSLASAVLLYGLALLYGATGSTWYQEMRPGVESSLLLLVGGGLVAVGLAFKISLVPLHLWTPDVYQGAPTTVTAFMSVATKTAALGALVRLFGWALGYPSGPQDPMAFLWTFLFTLAGLTMIVGNLMALPQTDVKRMLAFSGVAQAGYLMVGPLSATAQADQAMFFYLTAYAFMNVGAFMTVAALETEDQPVTRESLRGLAGRNPVAAAVLAVCLISLAGLPPTGGFLGKFYLFGAALHSGSSSAVLAALGIATSLLGAIYYLGTALTMFAAPDEESQAEPHFERSALPVMWICLVGTLAAGLGAGFLVDWLQAVLVAIG